MAESSTVGDYGHIPGGALTPSPGNQRAVVRSRPNRPRPHRPETELVAILSQHPEWSKAVRTELAASNCRAAVFDLDGAGSLKAQLTEAVRRILSEPSFRAVISEAAFINQGQRITVADPLISAVPEDAGSIVAMFTGAGLPILVHNCADPDTAWACGVADAKPAMWGHLYDSLKAIIADHDAQYGSRREFDAQNNFAPNYDRCELDNPASAIAIRYENDYVEEAVRDYARSSIDPIRILDIGCGSGRFEEILLSDAHLANCIGQVIAVDFAPEHLCRAQHRVNHFLPAAQQSKIIWLRRLAQNLQWPSAYFDIVIAGFAVVSFVDPIRVLQQAHRVLKPGGIFVGSAYNRAAKVYEFRKQIAERPGADRFPGFAARVDAEEGRVVLPDGSSITCHALNPENFEMVTRLAGLEPVQQKTRTFPILSGCLRRAYLDRMSGRNGETLDDVDVRGGGNLQSYQNRNLHVDPVLYNAELDLQQVMPGNGLYVHLTAIR